MMDGESRARVAARGDRGGEMPKNNGGQDSTTAPRSFHQALAQLETFTTFRYTLRGRPATYYLVSSEPITRNEALKALGERFGCANVLTVQPGGAA
ncbi:hypothetical protein [Thioalkalivibrio sp.]|uniref:hypothetical protein n=1 Tax=Thioalkalivibrio sp. TaxID=2093813 RepID=UPI0035686B1E